MNKILKSNYLLCIYLFRSYIFYTICSFYFFFQNKNKSFFYVFNHVPKTAGHFIIKTFESQFLVIKDYLPGFSFYKKKIKRIDIKNFYSSVLLSGHYNSDLPDEIISRFMIKNELDYNIYSLAKNLLKE